MAGDDFANFRHLGKVTHLRLNKLIINFKESPDRFLLKLSHIKLVTHLTPCNQSQT